MAVTTVPAREAAPRIRRALERGGRCTVEAGSRTRMLVHDPAVDRSGARRPWPLGLLGRHEVRYVVLEDAKRVSSHIYARPKLDEAIRYFLRELPPDAPVTITAD
jgi:hypothetical protein